MFGLNLPVIAGIGGIAIGGFLGGVAVNLQHDLFVHPGIVERVTAERDLICLTMTREAAQRATAAERDRQQRIADDALEAFRRETIAADAERVAMIEELEQENRAYANRLVAEGRSCVIDGDTIDWLRFGPNSSE